MKPDISVHLRPALGHVIGVVENPELKRFVEGKSQIPASFTEELMGLCKIDVPLLKFSPALLLLHFQVRGLAFSQMQELLDLWRAGKLASCFRRRCFLLLFALVAEFLKRKGAWPLKFSRGFSGFHLIVILFGLKCWKELQIACHVPANRSQRVGVKSMERSRTRLSSTAVGGKADIRTNRQQNPPRMRQELF